MADIFTAVVPREPMADIFTAHVRGIGDNSPQLQQWPRLGPPFMPAIHCCDDALRPCLATWFDAERLSELVKGAELRVKEVGLCEGWAG